MSSFSAEDVDVDVGEAARAQPAQQPRVHRVGSLANERDKLNDDERASGPERGLEGERCHDRRELEEVADEDELDASERQVEPVARVPGVPVKALKKELVEHRDLVKHEDVAG
jgi:hypothetical protein